MKKITVALTALLFASSLFAAEGFVTGGWADNGKFGYANAKKTVRIDDETYPDPVKKRKAFTNAIESSGEKFIIVSGDIDLSDGKVSDSDHSYFDKFGSDGKRTNADLTYLLKGNKTIIGTNNARLMFGGLEIKDGESNIIIRNITFYDAHGSTEYNTKIGKYINKKASADALNINYDPKNGLMSKNIWVDHCTFTDGTCRDLERNFNHDGQFDIKAGKNITVSYCEFTNHDKVMLIGNGDDLTKAEDRQITVHHSYFHGVIQRLPRTRGCQFHTYNNVFDGVGNSGNSGACFGPGIGARFIIENNYFGKLQASYIMKIADTSPDAKAPTVAKIYASGNNKKIDSSVIAYEGSCKVKNSADHLVSEKPFVIPYEYTLDSVEGLEKTIPQVAGANKVKIEINGVEY